MEKYNNCGTLAANVAIRVSAASEIQGQIETLAERLQDVSERVARKLEPVMMPEREEMKAGPVCTPEPMIPPYFDTLRLICRRMDRSIDGIESALNRTGL